jgi:hypothetical protein
MSKQTAVEWLEQEFIKLESTVGVFGVMYELIEKAKQMEREQMIDAILDNRNITSQVTLRDAEQYYNETYGGQDETL